MNSETVQQAILMPTHTTTMLGCDTADASGHPEKMFAESDLRRSIRYDRDRDRPSNARACP
jgi:hypothetical protein